MCWQTPPPKPEPIPEQSFKHGPILLSVRDSVMGMETWQYCKIEFGRHSSDPAELCRKSWPSLAISEARAALDDLERHLKEQS